MRCYKQPIRPVRCVSHLLSNLYVTYRYWQTLVTSPVHICL